ncbi:hypothetical protein CEXT_547941 [Caerostris extrusa]|uniref:Uncharacterized protein n=1 Tax=Caerostris extrusa TaxID=172846 RepID=A0AAV4P0V1_CAEEX|nr:hypothetical protein CEXT_547941 [Caerostris extrusa]
MCHTYSPMTEYHPSASLLGFHREKRERGLLTRMWEKPYCLQSPAEPPRTKLFPSSLARFSLTTKQVVSWWVTVSTFCSQCFDLRSSLSMWKRMDLRLW